MMLFLIGWLLLIVGFVIATTQRRDLTAMAVFICGIMGGACLVHAAPLADAYEGRFHHEAPGGQSGGPG